jgi:hypothetical protein
MTSFIAYACRADQKLFHTTFLAQPCLKEIVLPWYFWRVKVLAQVHPLLGKPRPLQPPFGLGSDPARLLLSDALHDVSQAAVAYLRKAHDDQLNEKAARIRLHTPAGRKVKLPRSEWRDHGMPERLDVPEPMQAMGKHLAAVSPPCDHSSSAHNALPAEKGVNHAR